MTLSEALRTSVAMEEAAARLKTALTIEDLAMVWFEHCDGFEGEAREHLRKVYRDRLMGVSGALVG